MVLLLDIGNSNLKWTLSEGRSLGPVSVWPHRDRGMAGLESYWRNLQKPERILVASVAGLDSEQQIITLTQKLWQCDPVLVRTQRHALGVTLAYAQPERFGVDRWMALIAAFHQYPCPALVIDCGTAITLDALDANGQHLGGLIIPGLRMMWDSLFQGTHIPASTYQEHVLSFGRDTGECVIAGAQQAVVGAIERAQREVYSRLGVLANLVMCGSDAPKLIKFLSQEVILARHLVLQGLLLSEEQ